MRALGKAAEKARSAQKKLHEKKSKYRRQLMRDVGAVDQEIAKIDDGLAAINDLIHVSGHCQMMTSSL